MNENDTVRNSMSLDINEERNMEVKRKWWEFDKNMWRYKLHFFLMFGAFGTISPYFSILVVEKIGLSPTSLGTVAACRQFIFMFTKPVIGYIADYFNSLKGVIFVLTSLQVLLAFSLLLIPHTSHGIKPINKLTIESFVTSQLLSNKSFSDDKTFSQKQSYILCLNRTSECVENPYLLQDPMIETKTIICSRIKNATCDICSVTTEDTTSHPFSGSRNSSVGNQMCYRDAPCVSDNIAVCEHISIEFFQCCKQSSIEVSFINKTITNTNETNHKNSRSDILTYQLWSFLVVFTFFGLCSNALIVVADTACCEGAQKHNKDLGKQRLWGSISWGLLAILGGFLNDYTRNYTAACVVFAIQSAVMMWNVSSMNLDKPKLPKTLLKNIGSTMSNTHFLFFQIGAFLSGTGLGILWYFLVWFIRSLGGSQFVCGLIFASQFFAGDVPFMFLSSWLVKKIGYFNITTLSLMANAIQLLWLSQLQNPWYALPVTWLHGISYGVFYTAMVSFAKMKSKPGSEATTQALMLATHDGLGECVGNALVGLGFDYFGGHVTFLYLGIFFACCVPISLILTVLSSKLKRQSQNS